MKTQRLFALILGSMMVVACAGATPSAAPPSDASSPPAPSDAASAEAPSGVPQPPTDTTATLSLWTYLISEGQVRALDAWIAAFNEKYPNVTVEHEYVPYDQYTTKLVAAAAAQQGPDVLLINGVFTEAFASAGALYDLTDWWNAFPDAKEFATATISTVGDRVYAVQGYTNLLALWYNKTILDELGIPPPTTVAELDAALATIKADGKYTGLLLCGKPTPEGEFNAQPWFGSNGVDYSNIDQPKTAEIFKMFEDWSAKGYIPKDVVNLGQYEAFQQWLGGQAAFTENGNWNITDAKANAKFEWGVVQMPPGSEGISVNLGGESEAIGGFSKQPDLAWAFIETTLWSKEGQLTALKEIGSIPTRSDAAADPLVADDPVYATFASEIPFGVPLPAGDKLNQAQQAFSEGWSAVLAGQKDGETVAAEVIDAVTRILE